MVANDNEEQVRSGVIRRWARVLLLDGDDGLTLTLDCEPALEQHTGRRVTLRGFAYSIHRFDVTGVVAVD